MKVIIPLAGLGKRMRPHTWSKPKPLLQVAGKPVLGHVLDKFLPIKPSEVIFITGWLGDQITDYVSANYDLPAHYVEQTELKGQAHAIYLAREFLSGPCIIVFVDTLFEADLTGLVESGLDGVLYVKEVPDPRRFGVVVEEAGRVTQLIEKPEDDTYRNVMVGLYYVREGLDLVRAIETLIKDNRQTKGEFYLADALQVMIEDGARFGTCQVGVWEDCGTPEALLHTNRYLLANGHAQAGEVSESVVIEPVYIAASAQIERSVVGPYVTVGANAHISNTVIRDAIVEEGASIRNMIVANALVGQNAQALGMTASLNIGDDVVVDMSSSAANDL
ncbi:MAG: NTP transferase domain-containing protein [Chloroflexi bacterium]|nr:NTP transferase domain-containing protein [Chloroflexota bacterium]